MTCGGELAHGVVLDVNQVALLLTGLQNWFLDRCAGWELIPVDMTRRSTEEFLPVPTHSLGQITYSVGRRSLSPPIDMSVSRDHATVTLGRNGLTLVDTRPAKVCGRRLASTTVNGRKLVRNTPCELKARDSVVIGTTEFKVMQIGSPGHGPAILQPGHAAAAVWRLPQTAEQMVDMGFERTEVKQALKLCGGNFDSALEQLTQRAVRLSARRQWHLDQSSMAGCQMDDDGGVCFCGCEPCVAEIDVVPGSRGLTLDQANDLIALRLEVARVAQQARLRHDPRPVWACSFRTATALLVARLHWQTPPPPPPPHLRVLQSLAFCMGRHERLGQQSEVRHLPAVICELICEMLGGSSFTYDDTGGAVPHRRLPEVAPLPSFVTIGPSNQQVHSVPTELDRLQVLADELGLQVDVGDASGFGGRCAQLVREVRAAHMRARQPVALEVLQMGEKATCMLRVTDAKHAPYESFGAHERAVSETTSIAYVKNLGSLCVPDGELAALKSAKASLCNVEGLKAVADPGWTFVGHAAFG